MIEPRPSIARILSLIATSIFSTLIATVLAIVSVILWERYGGKLQMDFWTLLLKGVDEFPAIVGSFCLGALLSSPLILRLARVSKLWPAALLATTAVGLTTVLIVTERLSPLERLLDHISPSGTSGQFPMLILATFAQVVNTAVLCVLYRLGGRYLRRARRPEDPDPEPPPLQNRPRRSAGTRAEFGALASILVGILLFLAGLDLVIREMLVRQIPAAIWEVLQNPTELTLLALRDSNSNALGEFHYHDIAQQVIVTSARDRAAVVTCLKRGIRNWWKPQSAVSGSEYGLRVTGATQVAGWRWPTVDLVISFHSEHLIIFDGPNEMALVAIHGSSTELDAILKSAQH